MKQNLWILLLAIAFLGGFGCVPTRDDVVAKWKGKPISAAIAELGPPDYRTPLPGGVTIYVWEQQYGSATASSRARCKKGLHVDDKSGIIIDASQKSGSLLCD